MASPLVSQSLAIKHKLFWRYFWWYIFVIQYRLAQPKPGVSYTQTTLYHQNSLSLILYNSIKVFICQFMREY